MAPGWSSSDRQTTSARTHERCLLQTCCCLDYDRHAVAGKVTEIKKNLSDTARRCGVGRGYILFGLPSS